VIFEANQRGLGGDEEPVEEVGKEEETPGEDYLIGTLPWDHDDQ